jgi:hypothetical protein
MTTYHRCTNSESPLSEWGHAMFSAGLEEVRHYGRNHFLIEDEGTAPHISEFFPLIRDRIIADIETGDFDSDFDYFRHILKNEETLETFLECYSCGCLGGIVNSAGAWDCWYGVWIAFHVLDELGVYTVVTDNGAVSFDVAAIKRVGENHEI